MSIFEELRLNFNKVISSLNYDYVETLAYIIGIVVIVLATYLLSNLIRSEQTATRTQRLIEISKSSIIKTMKSSVIKSFNHAELEAYINASGLAFMTNYKMTPLIYMMIRLGAALFIMIIGLQVNLLFGVAGFVAGYFAVDFVVNMSDKSDNEKMLHDIENIYDTLRIQSKAGVYITTILTDCYLVVGNKRLKSALLKLTSDIAAKNDLEESLDIFRARFRNEYIDTLVIIIKQSMKTGQATQMFDDIRGQIADINASMLIAEKQRINSKIIMVQILLYMSIIIVAVYVSYIALTANFM